MATNGKSCTTKAMQFAWLFYFLEGQLSEYSNHWL
jgi:hypothetical protein